LSGQSSSPSIWNSRETSDALHRNLLFSNFFLSELIRLGLSEIVFPFGLEHLGGHIAGRLFGFGGGQLGGPIVGFSLDLLDNLQNRNGEDWVTTATRISIDFTARTLFTLADQLAPGLGYAGSIGYSAGRRDIHDSLMNNPVTNALGSFTYWAFFPKPAY